MTTNQNPNQPNESRREVMALLRASLAEKTDNRPEEIREESLVYSELNLTEYDLARIVAGVGKKLELDSDSLAQAVSGDDNEIATVGDIVDLIVEEKELG